MYLKFFKYVSSSSFSILGLILFSQSCFGQISPEPPPELEPLPDRNLPPLEIPQEDMKVPERQFLDGSFVIRKFNIVGSTIFTETELQEIVAPFSNRPISFLELNEAVSLITEKYRKNGYITSGASISRQEIIDGIINVQVIEGVIDQINVIGLSRLNSDYVRSRVRKATKKPFNRERLLESLQLLQSDPLIESVSGQLIGTGQLGVSIVNVNLTEADPFTLQLSLDNQRSSFVGSFQRRIDIEHLNLFGLGDRFTVGYVNTDGSNSLNNLSYTIPINASNGTVSFNHSRTASDLINLDPAFDPLTITADTIDYNLTYRQPLFKTPNQEVSVGVTASVSNSETLGLLEGDDTPFPISVEANDRGEVNISAIRFFQEYITRDRRSVFLARSEFNLGVNIFDATIDNNPQFNLPDSRFFVWRGATEYLRLLNREAPFTTLILRGNLQFANDILLPREQFDLGGFASVRGYPQNVFFGDNGLFLSAELRQPILSIEKWDLDLQVVPFIDFGTVWNNSGSNLNFSPRNTNTLTGVGVGLILNIGNNFDARFDWGIPLNDIDLPKNNLQENGLYFQIRYRPQ